jgi:hypothetical protein
VRVRNGDTEDEAHGSWLDETTQPVAHLALGPITVAELVDDPERVGPHGRRHIPRLGLKDRGERTHVQRAIEVAR